MSFGSYTDFGVSLSSWMDISSGDLSSNVTDLITIGETRIFREARTRDMETAFSDSITAGFLTLPAGYLALKTAYVNTAPNVSLERRSAEWIRLSYPQNAGSGIPKFIARYGQNFMFGPYPASGYTINGIYYKQPTPISPAGLNTLFTNNPDLYLFACLAESEIIIGRDSRTALWEAKYQRILADANGMDRAEDASGSSLQMRVASLPSYRPVSR